MGMSAYDFMRTMHDAGYTMTDILTFLNDQLELHRTKLQPTKEGRKVALAQTNLESSLLYLKYYNERTGEDIGLICESDEY